MLGSHQIHAWKSEETSGRERFTVQVAYPADFLWCTCVGRLVGEFVERAKSLLGDLLCGNAAAFAALPRQGGS